MSSRETRHATRRAPVVAAGALLVATIAALCATSHHVSAVPTTRPAGGQAELGVNADLHGLQLFPADDPFNREVSDAPVDPGSATLIARIGASHSLHPDFGTVYNGHPSGIPYVVVSSQQPKVPVKFTDSPGESDRVPYPIPDDAPIEGDPRGDGDRHVLVLVPGEHMLYELYAAKHGPAGWEAGSGAVFDLTRPTSQRPDGWTSADAAGLPILPGLVRYDEVVGQKQITHALRFTVERTSRSYLSPARHFASTRDDASLPPMGMRVRLKAGYDISTFSPEDQVILTALKHYGMILADNGSNWFISGSPDARWNDDALHALTRVHGSDFEVVQATRK
jgi:hypothetical protein